MVSTVKRGCFLGRPRFLLIGVWTVKLSVLVYSGLDGVIGNGEGGSAKSEGLDLLSRCGDIRLVCFLAFRYDHLSLTLAGLELPVELMLWLGLGLLLDLGLGLGIGLMLALGLEMGSVLGSLEVVDGLVLFMFMCVGSLCFRESLLFLGRPTGFFLILLRSES